MMMNLGKIMCILEFLIRCLHPPSRGIEEDDMVMVPTWFWPVEESSIASPLKRIQERIREMETIRALPPQPKEPLKVGPPQSKDTGNMILQLPMEVQKRVHRSPGPEFQTMLPRQDVERTKAVEVVPEQKTRDLMDFSNKVLPIPDTEETLQVPATATKDPSIDLNVQLDVKDPVQPAGTYPCS